MAETPIPPHIALTLCEEIQAANAKKKISFKKTMCWGCTKYSKSPQQRCFSSTPENRGCPQVNALHDKVYQ
nr:hypothetical protein [Candidatus Sigynarchaeota archaeon]